jgi:hypothetical protein
MTTANEQDSTTFISERELHVGQLQTPICLHIYRRGDGTLTIHQSHFLKTAVQYLPHTTQPCGFRTEQELLDSMQDTLDKYYALAVGRGYTPSEDWLVKNTKSAA